MTQFKGRVLSIAGSDSGGGAGIQADIKTITALGGYAMTAITAITVQNTLGVSGVAEIPPDIVRAQIEAVVTDLGADAWKTGMLGSAAHVRTVAEAYRDLGGDAPLIVDPVMIAKGGAQLLSEEAVATMRAHLIPLAAIVTPNAPEAQALTGIDVRDVWGQHEAADILLGLGARAVLVKGGHIPGDMIYDVLMTDQGPAVLDTPRIATRATHGTGCTLASAIATHMALGVPAQAAVVLARGYLIRAIEAAPGFGAGHQPLGHGWTVNPER
ncbi:MAG TPA: bifunctional hydroxymethylpyrimidine kinase/phosphomethylpyrimidine kinase [Caulobacterales bacterium]|nr:bifunctional hydroxymethylpyrimidine kinase/phosphomethylpyrimidine kinase [Caulobacterales bacterium]